MTKCTFFILFTNVLSLVPDPSFPWLGETHLASLLPLMLHTSGRKYSPFGGNLSQFRLAEYHSQRITPQSLINTFLH